MAKPNSPKIRSRFESQLVVSKTTASEWTVYEPLVYHSALLASLDLPHTITVPFGFSTDFASVPRGLWNLFPPDGSYTAASVVHDWLFRKTNWPCSICNGVFLEAMVVCKTPWYVRWIMWAAVSVFGGAVRKKML